MFEKEHINLVFIYVLVFLQLPSTCAYVPMPVNKRPVFRVMKYGKHYSCLTRGMLGQAYRGIQDRVIQAGAEHRHNSQTLV